MRLVRHVSASIGALLIPIQAAHAQPLNFRGVAAATCALTAPTDGIITLGADLQSWATTTPATITATNTASATVTMTRPTTWTTSPAGTPATTFNHTGTYTGTNNGTLVGTGDAKTAALTALGATIFSVSLAATATSPFRAGEHVAQVTVTCTVP